MYLIQNGTVKTANRLNFFKGAPYLRLMRISPPPKKLLTPKMLVILLIIVFKL